MLGCVVKPGSRNEWMNAQLCTHVIHQVRVTLLIGTEASKPQTSVHVLAANEAREFSPETEIHKLIQSHIGPQWSALLYQVRHICRISLETFIFLFVRVTSTVRLPSRSCQEEGARSEHHVHTMCWKWHFVTNYRASHRDLDRIPSPSVVGIEYFMWYKVPRNKM